MPALNFKAKFADAVENGDKTQSIRAWRKRPFKVGDRVHLYTGMRTKSCRKLGVRDCIVAIPIEIRRLKPGGLDLRSVVLDGEILSSYQVGQLARADGFESPTDFYEFFVPDNGIFHGQLIAWAVPI